MSVNEQNERLLAAAKSGDLVGVEAAHVAPVTLSTSWYRWGDPEDGESPRHYYKVRQKTMAEVQRQFEAALDGVEDEDGTTAKAATEWISPAIHPGQNPETIPFPEGELFAAVRPGSNEGYLIQLFALDRSGRRKGHEDKVVADLAMTAKFLSGKDFVHRAYRAVSNAIEGGMFQHDLLEDADPAERIVNGHPEYFDAVEIQAVAEYPDGDGKTCCEPVSDLGQADLFSVYLHYDPDNEAGECGVACVDDFQTHQEALAYAHVLAARYYLPVNDFSPSDDETKAPVSA